MIAGLLSLVLPGLGQAWVGRRYRGVALFGTLLLAVLATVWYRVPGWYAVPAAIWLWNVWDAASLARGVERSLVVPVLAMLVMGYGIGWRVTQINLGTLARNSNRVAGILRPMLHPDFAVRREKQNAVWAPVQVPCSPQPPAATNTKDGMTVSVTPVCGRLRDTLEVNATGLWPDTKTLIQWATPIGNRLALGADFAAPFWATTDAKGTLDARIQIPPSALAAAPDPNLPLEHRVYLTQARVEPGFKLSENGKYVIEGIVQTLFLALMATTFGAIGAMLIAFPAARNLMSANWFTLAIYFVTRTVLNIVRSIEALIIAIVFVVIVGLGPFAGVIAITMHTIAALGKLYSEAIEGIDPGPLEATRASGGTWLQMVRYAVLPQIVPAFASFTLFRWDINVRTSTIIGFVGGGGIGFFLYQWIIKGDFRAVGSSFIAIAVIVIVLDFVSARLRTRLV